MTTLPTALITGASTGIGATYAERLARRGHDLILVARDLPRLDALADRLRTTTQRRVETLRADLTDAEDLARIEHVIRDDARIGVLVNNAGMAVAGPVTQSDAARLDAMVQLNVVASSRLAVAAAQAFRTRGAGTLINLASVLALAPERFNGVYNASKAFMLSLSQSLQTELQGTAVRVQAVLPGATRTEIWQRAGVDDASFDPSAIMEVGDMVDAALDGLDRSEPVTIPSLPDIADWNRMEAARVAMMPNLSRDRPAARYLPGGRAA